MSRSTKRMFVWTAFVLALVIGLGVLTSGFTSWKPDDIKNKFEKKRNEDNLIISEVVDLKTGKSTVSDVRYEVDENLVVTLNGVASAQEDIVYGKIVLPAGTYSFTGAPESTNKTYLLGLRKTGTTGDLTTRSDMGAFTVASSTTYDIVIRVMENCSFNDVKIYPVIVKGATPGEFWQK